MPAVTRIANQHLTVEVSPLGAEMQALTTADGRSFLWNGDAAFWTGRSPVLFPMVGKAPENRITIEGKSYEMAQHGFARRTEFSLAVSTGTLCRYELAASDATRAVYPFEFLLAVEHALEGRRLTVSAEVENRDTRPMPFGLGFHPAFVWPLPGAAGRPHTVTLDNGAEPALVRLESGLVKREKLPSPFKSGRLTLDRAMFEADAMIFPEGAGEGLTYAADGGPALKFSFENLPNLALWQKPGAPFICIEPWHGTAAELGGSDDLANRPYGVTLPPGETARFAFTVEVGG
ncbi:aldose 1-epimerase family protein [Neorhizobium sp. CSC1952]|uniref:aldose 1-epimerase family protein n=1 Tax=Neorhizobium sp. CSC1952 TaxID=2978974 RepID=UPI0025A68082|nr:aldose 1-epimerase family protein [Rhizobium sp. CSC1952]WJR67697.1 aldose 1-epimerase family protein [Rhizobium sp. CSC1952]